MADLLNIEDLRSRLAAGQYRLSDHALKRTIERNISAMMIQEAGGRAEVIEDYPDDKYSPSCLLLGFTSQSVPLHMQVSRLRNPTAKIITLYVPDPSEWIDHRIRKPRP